MKNEPSKAMEFLSFKDWLERKEHHAQDWIAVARQPKGMPEYYSTFSVLASTEGKSLERILSTHEWEILAISCSGDFGRPYFDLSDKDDLVFHSGLSAKIDGVAFQPFTLYRNFHGFRKMPNRHELVQNFLFYHDAFLIEDEQKFIRITEDGELETVVKYEATEDEQIILVSTHHLKDYLAANRSYLVRYHDHRRWLEEDITEQIGGQFTNIPIITDSSRFEIWLRTDGVFKTNDYKSGSRLVGKDIVHPYPQPDKRHRYRLTGEMETKYVTFIVGRDDTGEEIEVTCSQEELSNFFTDRGEWHYLTSVFFEPGVLKKYYDEPSRFRITDGYVRCLDIWGIKSDETKEDLVQVYLGDLGLIPYGEQTHWRHYNVAPRGGMTESRFRRDFLCEPAEPTHNVIYSFRKAFESAQRVSIEKLKDPLFKPQDERDSYLYEALHLPLSREWKAFDEMIQALSKIVVDSLNVKLLKHMTGKTGKSLELLEVYLDQQKVQERIKAEVLVGFRMVQDLRSTGTAHRKGTNYDEMLARYELSTLSNQNKARKTVITLTRSMNLLLSFLSRIRT